MIIIGINSYIILHCVDTETRKFSYTIACRQIKDTNLFRIICLNGVKDTRENPTSIQTHRKKHACNHLKMSENQQKQSKKKKWLEIFSRLAEFKQTFL